MCKLYNISASQFSYVLLKIHKLKILITIEAVSMVSEVNNFVFHMILTINNEYFPE
jgi:hypothetical protein